MPLLTEPHAADLLRRLRELRADAGRANLLQSYEALGVALITLKAEASGVLARQEEAGR
jgi:Zn-dependent protease with chaperone function